MSALKFHTESVKKEHIPEVIALLQSISDFSPPENQIDRIWNEFESQPNVFSLVVIHQTRVVGYGSIIVSTRIRGGRMGHVEDIVSHHDYRGKGIGKIIMSALFEISKEQKCYKITLQCKEHNIPFYKKCHFQTSAITMQRFLTD